jgi:hypothetical protein
MKRARATGEMPLAAAPSLGFGAYAGGTAPAAAAAEWGEWSKEGSEGRRRARLSPELRRRPRGVEELAVVGSGEMCGGFSSHTSGAIERAAADAQSIPP